MKKVVKVLVLLPLLLGTAKLGAQVTIGADAAPKAYSVLELVAKYKTSPDAFGGLRLPQMTTAQRDALGDFTSVDDAYGLMIYNMTVNCVEYWNSKKWVSLCTGRADITLTGDCDTDHRFAADGSDVCTFTPEDHPPCVMSSGVAYQIYLAAGSAYATIVVDDFTSAFTLTFAPNNSNNSRIAVVRVINNCSGEYQDFPFYQDGAECPMGVTLFTLGKSPISAEICGDNGAVIAWVDSPDPGIDYIWEYGGTIVHTGTYMQITYPGRYTVYAGLLGCETTPSQFIDVTKNNGGSSSGAPTVTATNDGILCGNGGVVILTANGIAAGNTVQWFHNGEHCTTCLTNPLTLSGASAAGEWFATQQDGSGCGSKMSNIVKLYDQTTGSTALDPPIATVNGVSLIGGPHTICKGGTIELEVTNSYPAGTVYEWFDGTTSIYKGTDSHIYSVAPGKSSMTLSVQVSNNSGGCPNTATSSVIIIDLDAPATPTIDGGTLAICGSAPANLLAMPSSYMDYEWFFNGTKITTPDANNPTVTASLYKATDAGNYTVRYYDGDCWSLLSVAVAVVQSTSFSLSWKTAPLTTVIKGSTESYTVEASFPDGVTYEWESSDPALATITPIGNTASIDFADATGDVTITVTATNACGTVTLSELIQIGTGCTPITSLTLSPAGPLTKQLDGSGNWKTLGDASQSFTANVLPPGSATNYEWFEGVTSKQNGASDQYNYAPPQSVGSYTVYVEATNGCSSKNATATIHVTQDSPPDVSGYYRISGKACYDVYVTDWTPSDSDSDCLPKSIRIDDFAGGKYTFVYNFISSIPAPSGFSDLTWEITKNPEGVIINSAQSGTYGEILSITFKSDPTDGVKKKAEGTNRTTALQATITAKYKDNNNDPRQVSMDIFIQDCTCGCSVKTSGGGWLTFMCYNMGADPSMSIAEQMAHTPSPNTEGSIDKKVYGWLYQWGRKADGHQERNSPAVSVGSGTITYPGGYDANEQITTTATSHYGRKITITGGIYDWHGNSTSSEKIYLWRHTDPLGKSNNPCPAGWRVPTQGEWCSIFRGTTTSGPPNTATANKWDWNSSGTLGFKISPDGGVNYTLFLPAAGYRNTNTSALYGSGINGGYWSSDVNDDTRTYTLNFQSGSVIPANSNFRALGLSLRCVADE